MNGHKYTYKRVYVRVLAAQKIFAKKYCKEKNIMFVFIVQLSEHNGKKFSVCVLYHKNYLFILDCILVYTTYLIKDSQK